MPLERATGHALVSIGMPVYNEAEYLPQALDCLLSQKYPDIEFVLADNASSDGTLEICLRAAETDKRVAVLSADANMGATENFLRCATAANGEFFMWAGGHDRWSPEFVSSCVDALTRHSTAVIAVPESNWIDHDGSPIGNHASILDTRDMDPLARVFSLFWANMHPIYGLMRTTALRQALPLVNCPGADLVLLMRLILMGDFVPAHQALWSRRRICIAESYAERQKRYQGNALKIAKNRFGMLKLVSSLMGTVWTSPLGLKDKLAFTLAFPALLPARYLVARRRVI